MRARILVVDDDPDIRLILGLNLSLAGMDYAEAGDGAHALRLLNQESWDGCVLDLAMPGVDGLTVLRTIGESETRDDLAVIVLSARSRPVDALQVLHLGAHAHHVKPFSPRALAAAVEELVALSPAERAQHRARMLARVEDLERIGMPTV